jgi:hypothetical protein
MTPLRQQAAILAVGAASIITGAALVVANVPTGRALIGAGIVGLALTLGTRR